MVKTTLISKLSGSVLALLLLNACSGGATKDVEENPALSSIMGAELCDPALGAPFSYRKKIAVLATDVRDLQEASDLAGLHVAWSQAIQQKLEATGQLLTVDSSDQHLHVGMHQSEWIANLAMRQDAQFVVAVRFENLHVSRSQLGSGNYAITLPGAQRQIDAELSVFDGYSGTRMARFFYTAEVKGFEGDVVNPVGQPVMKGAFLDTELGEAMARIATEQVENVRTHMACLPMVARVAKVVGDEIHVQLPGTVGVRPGEVLQLFRRMGKVDAHLGPVEVLRVFPEAVVAAYRGEGRAPGFNSGMIVRAW